MKGPIVWGSCFPTDEAVCKECLGLINFDRAMHLPKGRTFKTDPCEECLINERRVEKGEGKLSYGY